MRKESKEPPRHEVSKKWLFNLNDAGELFNIKELLDNLKFLLVIQENRKYVFSLITLTKEQVKNKLKGAIYTQEKKFGKNDCLIYQLYVFPDRLYLCLYNGDNECF